MMLFQSQTMYFRLITLVVRLDNDEAMGLFGAPELREWSQNLNNMEHFVIMTSFNNPSL